MKAKNNKAVAYCRFSSHLQREESIDAQLRAIHEYAYKQGLTIVAEYVDRAKSATTDNRPEFQRMIKDSHEQEFCAVIVHKLDRFARDRYDSAHYRHQLKRNGARLLSVVENLDGSPESIIMESVLEGMAEYYSRNLAREVEKGKRENALKGLHAGGMPPLGYSVDKATMKLVINEHEAKAVRLIFGRILEGYSYEEVINELNLLGFKTRMGNHFGKNSLHNLLKNEKYTGVYVYSKSAPKDADGKRNGHKYKDESEIIRVEGAVPPLVDKDDFQLVQEKMKNRKQARPNAIETYLLKTKTVCGCCGGSYVGGRRRRSKGGMYTSYACNNRARRGSEVCQNREISRPYIEGIVLERLAEYVFGNELVPQVTKDYNAFLLEQSGGSKQQVKELTKRMQELQRQIDTALELVMQSKAHSILERLETLEKDKASIEMEIRELESAHPIQQVDECEVRAVFAQIRRQLAEGSLPHLQRVIETYVYRIEIHPDKVIVVFNFFPKIRLGEILTTKKESPQPTKQGLSFSTSTMKMVNGFGGEGEI